MAARRSRETAIWPAACFLTLLIGFAGPAESQQSPPPSNANVDDKPTASHKPPPTFSNVPYGPNERHVLDFWQSNESGARPLVVFVHGGGFVRGDKRSFPAALLQTSQKHGCSFASINYRLVGNGVTFPAPQQDGARAIQFLRSRASEWKIDPARIAICGDSAGAGISLWVAFKDDQARPGDPDPILRFSSRVSAVGSIGGQTTYDPVKIRSLIGGSAADHPSLLAVYGLEKPEQAYAPTPELQRLYDEASAITHLTADDPPAFLFHAEPDAPIPPNSRPGYGIHHPRFARMLIREMESLGIAWEYRHASDQRGVDPRVEMVEFFVQIFEKKTLSDDH